MAPVNIKDEPKVKNEPEIKADLKTEYEPQSTTEPKIKLKLKTMAKPKESPSEASSTTYVSSDTFSDHLLALPELVCPRLLLHELLLMGFMNKENEEDVAFFVTAKEKRVVHSVSFAKRLRSLVEKHVTTFPECKEWIEQAGIWPFPRSTCRSLKSLQLATFSVPREDGKEKYD